MTNPENEHVTDLNGREMSFFVPLVILMVAIGLFSRG
jgi:NADH:ubiquinone oxidoreductase subunit 4 (subunit M)